MTDKITVNIKGVANRVPVLMPGALAASSAASSSLAAQTALDEVREVRDLLIAQSEGSLAASFADGVNETPLGQFFYSYVDGQIKLYKNVAGVSINKPTYAGGQAPANPPFGEVVPPILLPGGGWNGAVDSGFAGGVSAPVDPARVTAKPAARFIVPPAQTFTDEMLIIVRAEALNNGSLIGGIEKVVFNYEGQTVEVDEQAQHSFTDANGNPVSYLGHAVTLKKPSGVEGEARLYAEVIPSDPAMQSRVLEMNTFPKASQYEGDLTVAPSQTEEGDNYNTITEALRRVSQEGWENARITIVETADYQIDRPGAVTYQTDGYITIEAAPGVTCTIKRPVADFATNSMRPRVGALWFKGENVVFDFATWTEFYHEGTGAKQTVLDGVTITNSDGRDSLLLGGTPPGNSWRFRGAPYFMECSASETQDTFRNAVLVRGCEGVNLSGDVWSAARCVIGSSSANFSSQYFRTPEDAFTIRYNGPSATGTVTLTKGSDDATGRELRLIQNGSTVATYTIWQSRTIQQIIDFVNSQTDWTATAAVPASARRATALSAAGVAAFGSFSNLDAKSADLQMIAAFDLHEDLYASGGGVQENLIFGENLAYDQEGIQLLHLKDASDVNDAVFVNNAVHPSGDTLDYSNLQARFSHFAFIGNSWARQTFRIFTGTGRDFDSRCVIAGNAMQTLAWSGSPDADLIIDSNHTATAAPAGATNHTTGGSTSTLWVDVASGDFRAAMGGELLANLKPPAVFVEIGGAERVDFDLAGSFGLASGVAPAES